MKSQTVRIKDRCNWPVTILLIAGIVLIILLPLYMALMIAIKDPSDMNNILALPTKLRLQNFVDAWNMTNFPRKFFNTAFITVINLGFTLVTNSFAAYAITRNRKKSKFFSILYYYFISAMFIPFQVIMLPLVVQANTFQYIPSGQYLWNHIPVYYLWTSNEYIPLYRCDQGYSGSIR